MSDNGGKYSHVKVPAMALNDILLKCNLARNRGDQKKDTDPPRYLLNKLLELVFSTDEIVEAKGATSLDATKLAAIKGNYSKLFFDTLEIEI